MDNNFAKELKTLRIEENLTQADVAKAIGCGQNTVSRWENGFCIPNIEDCIKLANFYNITIDELVGRDFQYKK